MESKYDLLLDEDVKKSLLSGILKVYKAVSKTYGPKGKIVLISGENDRIRVTKDGVTVAKELKLLHPIENMGAQMIRQAAMKTADRAGDGPQPLHAKIITPQGYTTFQDIKVNDIICGSKGTFQSVIGVFDKGLQEVCEVVFADGRIVECSPCHLWTIITKKGKVQTITTQEMIPLVVKHTSQGCQVFNFYIKPEVVNFVNNEPLNIDPFLLGLLLGDGSLSGTGSIELSLGLNKYSVIENIKLPKGMSLSIKYYEKKHYYRVKIKGCTSEGKYMKDLLNDLGLLGVLSGTKFIPKSYLTSSIETRKALLSGLLSTDGYINKKGLFEFSTISSQLVIDFVDLISSLGIPFYKRLHTRKKDIASYSKTPIYRIRQLKGYKQGYKIINIRRTGRLENMRCIKVSNADQLYFTDGYIMTHNTTSSIILAYHFIKEGMALVKSGIDANDIKRVWDICLKEAIEDIKLNARKITSSEDIENVAIISTNNDEVLGREIGALVYKMGANGIISVEKGSAIQTRINYVHGIQIDAPYITPMLVNAPKIMSTTFAQTQVFIYDGILYNIREIVHLLDFAHAANKPLLILATDIDSAAINQIEDNVIKNKAKWVVPKMIGSPEQKLAYMQDIAVLTNAKIFKKGHNTFDPLNKGEWLGTIDRVENNDLHLTLIVGDKQENSEIDKYIDSLEKEYKLESNEMTQAFIRNRINKLKGGVAVVHVGASTELEMMELKDRIEDAVLAAKSAMKEGISKGSGYGLSELTLFTLPITLNKSVMSSFLKVLKMPLEIIHANAGIKIPEEAYLNLNTGENVSDLFEEGIIDPTVVLIESLTNAVSVATMILLTEAIIYKEFIKVNGPPRINPGEAFPV